MGTYSQPTQGDKPQSAKTQPNATLALATYGPLSIYGQSEDLNQPTLELASQDDC